MFFESIFLESVDKIIDSLWVNHFSYFFSDVLFELRPLTTLLGFILVKDTFKFSMDVYILLFMFVFVVLFRFELDRRLPFLLTIDQ